MTFPVKPHLTVEALEARDTPNATVASLAGTLTVRGDNSANNVVITENAPGLFDVSVNGTPRGTYLARNISVSMGGANDTVDLGVVTTLPGSLTVNLGGGNDKFTTKNSTAFGAQIAGSVTINTGTGAAVLGAYDELIELYNVNFTGPSVRVTGAAGSGTPQLDMQSAFVGGTLTATNIYEVALGLPNDPAGAVVINHLVVDNTFKNSDSRTDAVSGAGNVLFMFSGSQIIGNVTVYGGPGRDDLNLPGDAGGGVADVFVGGNLTLHGRGGINTLALGNGTFGVTVGGNVTFTGGPTTDRFFFDSGSTVGRDVNVTLFGGSNVLFGDPNVPFDAFGTAICAGNMTLTLGDGNNFIGSFDLGSSLTVVGNLKLTVGNGNNLGGSASTPGAITLFNPNLAVGGTASFVAGRGSQTIEISNADLPRLMITLGGGANTVNFTIPEFHGNATIDFGFGPGPKAFETDLSPTDFTGILVLRRAL